MPRNRPGDPADPRLSYAIRRETPAQVLADRIGITSLLFGIGMAASVLLGRSRS